MFNYVYLPSGSDFQFNMFDHAYHLIGQKRCVTHRIHLDNSMDLSGPGSQKLYVLDEFLVSMLHL